MNEVINEPVSIVMVYNAVQQTVKPVKMLWRGREYQIEKIGYHHKEKQGNTLFHIFSVTSQNTAFKLQLDTETLHWKLQELYDTTGT